MDLDVDAILRSASRDAAEEGRKLAERLASSVLPAFVSDDRGRPCRLGSCVLARVDGNYFAFTAGHVVADSTAPGLWVAPSARTKLRPLPCLVGFRSPLPTHLDVGILPLRASEREQFVGRVFLANYDLDLDDRPDEGMFSEYYFVFGFPASNRQAKISHEKRHIDQRSFQLSTFPPPRDIYAKEGLPPEDHLLLEFDPRNIRAGGSVVNPPKLQGLSGGGMFRISRHTGHIQLTAIATEHRQTARVLVGTRIKYFVAAAQHLARTLPRGVFE
jgi:hypothetical protein